MVDRSDANRHVYHVHMTGSEVGFRDWNCYGRFWYQSGATAQADVMNREIARGALDNPSVLRYGLFFIVVAMSRLNECMGDGSRA